eukprot:jgi/Hompol1/699/HPOL_005386-RA
MSKLLRSTLPVYQVYAANTDVGKTIVSTALCRGAASLLASSTSQHRSPNPLQPSTSSPSVLYLKPVQTGFPVDSDERHVQSFCPSAATKTLFTYTEPASPHLTAIKENRFISDEQLRSSVLETVDGFAETLNGHLGIVFLETAGGVHSPAMSGSLQSDVYRPFRLPSLLVGDSKLGGISTTLSSYEALRLRGYDVPCIVMFENRRYDNDDIIRRNVDSQTRVFTISEPPPKPSAQPNKSVLDLTNMLVFYESIQPVSQQIAQHLLDSHVDRVRQLNSMPLKGQSTLWWPFTQHSTVSSPTVIDSAFGDDFTVFDPASQTSAAMFDACGSWWTQGVGHGSVELAKAAANAAGRYGHVIFPEVVHEPALNLADRLLQTAGINWASRVFFSDDGSTAIEVALKMAFKKTVTSRKLEKPKLEVIGVHGSYHGDTIGAMDISNPNTYNEQVNWYSGRGLWFEPPTISCKNGVYCIDIPESILEQADALKYDVSELNQSLPSRNDVFDASRNNTALARLYRHYIHDRLQQAEKQGRIFGALVIEPIILGAGGMIWVDPVFQRELVAAARSASTSGTAIPVIFDEIFVGMHRLGYASAGVSLLGVTPDIACYAKCMSGIVPIAVTLATEDVFRSFDGASKTDALLHGHSFTAHPVGCQAAVRSIDLLEDLHYQKLQQNSSANPVGSVAPSAWDSEILDQIATLPKVKGTVSIGTVLAIELSSVDTGYSSLAASNIVAALRKRGIFARPLGNVLYFMATHETPRERVLDVLSALHTELQHN